MRLLPLLSLAALIPPAVAQQSTTLDVVVTDKKGTPIPGLTQSDFVVHVDKRAEQPTSFHAETSATDPVEIILLIDAVNTRTTNVAYERSEIAKFLRSNGGHLADPTTAFILTDTKLTTLPVSTRDGNGLANAISKADIGLREFTGRQGFYSWSEQFSISARGIAQVAAYERTRPGRKLLLWISPGWPLLSGPEVELTRKEQEGFFKELVNLTRDLHDARMTLSSIDPLGTADAVSYRTVFWQQFTDPVPEPGKIQIGNLALQALATQSGGRVLYASNDTAGLLAQAASDATAFYTLTVPLPATESQYGFHTFAVETEKPGLKARSRTVLYTPTEGPATEPTPAPSMPPPVR